MAKKETKYCPVCGELTNSPNAKFCSLKCFHKNYSRRYGNGKEHPNREQLKQLIRTTPFEVIGRSYGVDGNSIRKWCDKYNLPRTKRQINQYTDEQWEKI